MTAATIAASLALVIEGTNSTTRSTDSRAAVRTFRNNSFLCCSIEIPSRSWTAATVFLLTPRARAMADMLNPSALIRQMAR